MGCRMPGEGATTTHPAHRPPCTEKRGPKEEKTLPKGETSRIRTGSQPSFLGSDGGGRVGRAVKTSLAGRVLSPPVNTGVSGGQGAASLQRPLGIRPSSCRQTAPSQDTTQRPHSLVSLGDNRRPHDLRRTTILGGSGTLKDLIPETRLLLLPDPRPHSPPLADNSLAGQGEP